MKQTLNDLKKQDDNIFFYPVIIDTASSFHTPSKLDVKISSWRPAPSTASINFTTCPSSPPCIPTRSNRPIASPLTCLTCLSTPAANGAPQLNLTIFRATC
ncbi:hypothetical protein AVEN_259870-1 [Araneus ventricosus]|uniref:Uncharacterized protein n=1 Tax=Araneus ventricosus TaxID=182803 RepID=A0A4Y2DTX9_ARAVE|nr:hypothetical protein AVEN_259870-1 [Araneus ventricosus]